MNIEKPSFKRICLMHIQALTNFPYIEKDFDAITDYELISKVVDYLNQVIANSNEQNTAITDLYDAFIELKDYVDNYFDNNFPELVNDKLDEMAEDGTLENLLNNKLKLITTYHTFTDVVEHKNKLSNGMIIKTLGYHTINDGGAATYYITNVESETDYQEDFDNNLYATLIINNYVTPEMFGAKGDGLTDDKDAIRKAISTGKIINFTSNKTYVIGYDLEDFTFNEILTKRANYIVITSPVILHGNNAKLKLITNPCAIYNGIRIQGVNNVLIDNLQIIGDRDTHTTTYLIDGYAGEWGHCLSIRNSSNIVINNVKVEKAWGDGLSVVENSSDVVLENCVSDTSRRNGLTIGSAKNVHVTNCTFKNTSGVAPQAGVDIEPDEAEGIYLKNIILDKCYSYNNAGTGFEVNTCSFSQVETNEIIDVKLINCKSEACYYGITYIPIPSGHAQAYQYVGTVLFDNCYILNPTAHGCVVQFEKPEKTPQLVINECIFDGYNDSGIYGVFNHSTDTDTIWGGAVVSHTKFTNVPSDTGQYKCAIMWGTAGFVSGNRYDLIIDKCHVDDSNPLYWGAITAGYGKIEWDSKPLVVQPQGYTHTRLNGLLIANRADNVGFILPSRELSNREYEVYCVTGTSCYVARYGYGDSSITTDDKIISTNNTSGSNYYTIDLAKSIKLVPYSSNYWIVS